MLLYSAGFLFVLALKAYLYASICGGEGAHRAVTLREYKYPAEGPI